MKKNKRFYPYHLLHGLGEFHTLYGVEIFVEIDDLPAPNIAVLLMSKNYVYFGITDEDGAIEFPKIADDDYVLYLAKSGVNQGEFRDIKFDEMNTSLEVLYKQEEKTVYNGMFANTPPEMYVDRLDGGGA